MTYEPEDTAGGESGSSPELEPEQFARATVETETDYQLKELTAFTFSTDGSDYSTSDHSSASSNQKVFAVAGALPLEILIAFLWLKTITTALSRNNGHTSGQY